MGFRRKLVMYPGRPKDIPLDSFPFKHDFAYLTGASGSELSNKYLELGEKVTFMFPAR